jgi:eukaryotic-like serine/threonine-protein kinase
MSETKHSLEEFLFEAALQKPSAAERAAFLDGACHDNSALRARLDVLLEGHFGGAGFLTQTPERDAPVRLAAPRVEEASTPMLGRYKLLEKIGEGGFGEVWMAEQREPVKRRVALKIIKLGMDSRQIVARFEAERQALAMMDHANIAKIFDADVTDTGRPYFVMELVRGIKITEYCDQNQLSTHERLRLFILVCQAIQHAHQKGIIHRDIKPSNILVTLHDGTPVPKVIDFGIAKATQQDLTDKTVFTQFQQFIGTPAYISPEQAEMSGLDIDTRADIYSLGVLLYELLVGQTPFEPKEMIQGGLDALRQIIREREPLRPSTKLNTLPGEARTTAGKRRRTDVGKLVHQLQGDLDWIVMKCLEKDRTRRYDTANGLAADLKRHLANEPVVARPPSAAYRFQKTWQRNKLAFTAGTVVLLALVVGIGVSTWQAIRATHAEGEQSRQREAAVKASASEAVQHKLADTQRDVAEAQRNVAVEQRKLADMQLALQMWEEGDVQRANDLIEASGPAPGQAPAFEWRYLRKLCRDQSIETFGDSNRPYRSALFFDRDWLLLNEEKQLTLHGLSGRNDQLLLEDPDGIWTPAFCSGNTNLLATVTDDGRIKVWDLAARRVRAVFEGHARSPTAATGSLFYTITFSRDGRWLASANSDPSVKLWDVEARNPKPVWTVHHYSYDADSVVFSPDGRQLFSSGSETMIRAWDVATGAEAAAPLEGHTGWVRTLATSPDGHWMASGSGDSTVIVWDVFSRKLVTRLFGHIAGINALAFSPDQQILASGGYDGAIQLWDLNRARPISQLRGHGAKVRRLSFSPNGQLLASQSDDGLVKLWHATPDAEGNALRGSPGWLQDVALSRDGRHLASVVLDTFAVNLWDLRDLPSRSLIVLTGHTSAVMCAAFSPDNAILATGSHDQTVRLWDVSGHKPVATLTNGFPVGSLAFSPDGRTLIVGGSKFYNLVGGRAGLQFWDVPSQQATGTIAGDPSDIVQVAWSDHTPLLATGHKDGPVSLWDAQTRRLLHRFESQFATSVLSLAFSPTEPLLAAGDYGGNIALYNTSAMDMAPPPMKAHSGRVMSLAFSPDGRTLASAGEGGGLKLWQVATRQVALTLKGHVGAVVAVAFSRDGNLLASCGADATVRLWPAATLKEADAPTKKGNP